MQPSGQVFLEARPRLLQARSAQWLEVPRNQSPAAVFVAGCSLPLPWGRTLVDFWALSQAGGRSRRNSSSILFKFIGSSVVWRLCVVWPGPETSVNGASAEFLANPLEISAPILCSFR